MASFISALSLFILILSNGCFTLPILDEQFSSSTYSPINDDLTTGETFNLRLVTDNETNVLPDINIKGSTDEHMGFEVSTSMGALSEDKTAQALRSFDEFSTSEPMTFTTEQSYHDKHDYDDSSFTTVEPTTFTTEQSYHDKRDYDDLSFSTVEPTTFTTESYHDKHDYDDLSFTTVEPTAFTTEQSYHNKREYDDSVLSSSEPTTFTTESYQDKREDEMLSTSEPISFTTEQSYHNKREDEDIILSTSEPMSFTTEQSYDDKREYNDLSFTTVEPITEVPELNRRGFINEFENETENGTQEMQTELTTSDMLTFTSTSSVVPSEFYTPESSTVPSEFYTSESSITTSTSTSAAVPSKFYTPESSTSNSTSTKKYVGLLKDEEEYEPKQSTKYIKYQRKPSRKLEVSSTKKSKIYSEEKSEEEQEEDHSKESTVPTAEFDQQALDKVANVPNDFLILDETNDLVVTGLPNKIFPTTMAYKQEEKEEKPLNQGKESSHIEEKESNN